MTMPATRSSDPSSHADHNPNHLDRRGFLTRLGSGLLVATGGSIVSAAAFAEELDRTARVRTPWQTEGPFYPRPLPLDKDNDLVIVNNALTPAVGEITHLSGRILDARGNPVKNAVIEIWQVDHHGVYLHTGSDNYGGRDKNFQGWGRFETGSTGEYRFRTIKPVPYPGRTPHIHVKVKQGERELLMTQWYIKGHPQNARDGVLNGIRDARQRASVQSDFVSIPGSKIGELAARFDIVLSETPGEGESAAAGPPPRRGGGRGGPRRPW
jgi:protocatechuate 3,4-dioxygenase beta subunit